MRSRSLRRTYEIRQKIRTKNRIKHTWFNGKSLAEDEKRIGKYSHVRGLCSCPMCGNPRKYFNKKTKQEVIQDQKFDYEE